MKPEVHAASSAMIFGGKPEDYLDIHQLLDSSRGAFPDLRHRALTHNSWFITTIIPRVFGETRKNSDGKDYSTRDVAEHHVLEDFRMKLIPSAQDFLEQIEFKTWMDNGRGLPPPSHKKLKKWRDAEKKSKKEGGRKEEPAPAPQLPRGKKEDPKKKLRELEEDLRWDEENRRGMSRCGGMID